MLPLIQDIINCLIRTKKFSSLWKYSYIKPLAKIKLPTNFKNYRPISILCSLSKVLEQVIYDQILDYMDANNLFDPCQIAYRKGFGTHTAVIKFTDDVRLGLDVGEITLAVILTYERHSTQLILNCYLKNYIT